MSSAAAPTPLPDLTLVVRRDGSIVSWAGGDAVSLLRKVLVDEQPGSEAARAHLARLAKQCIARRDTVEARFTESGVDYDLRGMPQGPDRVVCTLRKALAKNTDHTVDETGVQRRPGLERRGFTRLLRDRVASATLQELPLSLAVIQIDGLTQISQTIGRRTAERVFDGVLRKLAVHDGHHDLLGQIGENALALVLQDDDRVRIEKRLAQVVGAICEPQITQTVEFRLACHVGVASLGHDAVSPTQLLDQASASAAEARRSGSRNLRFHSDTVRVRALERFDLAKELRHAIETKQLGFRLLPRHELVSGNLASIVAYFQWPHPLRGDIAPSEFIAIAESVGLGASLSRSAFDQLCAGFHRHMKGTGDGVRLSFGPLRDHVLDEDFVTDVLRSCEMHGMPPERLELRLAERSFVNVDLNDLLPLQRRGVHLVVDEVGRAVSSLAGLSRAPLWGIQIDRACVTQSEADASSAKMCAAVAAIANSLGLKALATGVDTAAHRDRLLQLGYVSGTGDLYALPSDAAAKRAI